MQIFEGTNQIQRMLIARALRSGVAPTMTCVG
jgi:alkylation response protein AidB-like acyl-CoA dehydrogenase